jgi:hypothetical protein
MPQAGVSSRARRRSATPWWEELDRDAFQFPTEYRVKPAPRAVARTGAERANGAEAPVAVTERPVAATRPAAAVIERPVATAPRTAATARPPVAPARRMVPPSAAAPVATGGGRVADGGRRTVVIRGHGAERNLPVARPTLRRHERPGFRPDRAALWAVMLGLLLILVAATSAHAAILH